MDETGNKICEQLGAQDKEFSQHLIEIKNSSSAVQRQVEFMTAYRQNVPVQQDQVIAVVCDLYARIDQCQERIKALEHGNSQLRLENKNLETELGKYKKDQRPHRRNDSPEIECF